jgi:hypothetical protein
MRFTLNISAKMPIENARQIKTITVRQVKTVSGGRTSSIMTERNFPLKPHNIATTTATKTDNRSEVRKLLFLMIFICSG